MDMKTRTWEEHSGVSIPPKPQEGCLSKLTAGEWPVFYYTVHGFNVEDTASALRLSNGTVKNYRMSIGQKLKYHNADGDHNDDRGELVHLAIQEGILALPVGPELVELQRRYAILTTQEKTVMKATVAGCSNSEIAEKLNTSEQVIKNHRTNLMEKLQTHSLAGLIRAQLAFNEAPKLVEPPPMPPAQELWDILRPQEQHLLVAYILPASNHSSAAKTLGMASWTLRAQTARICAKLGVQNYDALLQLSLANGWVDAGSLSHSSRAQRVLQQQDTQPLPAAAANTPIEAPPIATEAIVAKAHPSISDNLPLAEDAPGHFAYLVQMSRSQLTRGKH